MEKRKGFLQRLFNKKDKKHSCCCDIQLEEIKDEKSPENQSKATNKNNSCCS